MKLNQIQIKMHWNCFRKTIVDNMTKKFNRNKISLLSLIKVEKKMEINLKSLVKEPNQIQISLSKGVMNLNSGVKLGLKLKALLLNKKKRDLR